MAKSVSPSIGPARITASVCDELGEACETLHQKQKLMIGCVEKACELRQALRGEPDCPVELDIVVSICNQLQQQTLLEVSVFETISNSHNTSLQMESDQNSQEESCELEGARGAISNSVNSQMQQKPSGSFFFTGLESPLDADSTITIMACYTYPPYLKLDDVKRLADM